MLALIPEARAAAWANRRFLVRVVRYLSAATTDGMDDQQVNDLAGVYEKTGRHPSGVPREAFAAAFDGFELVPPGVTSLGKWRADEPDPANLSCLCGLGRFTAVPGPS